ncbi:hypothetical protein PR202_gb03576 [Eleusine coracana subsp. coracana]|uniref:K Homology domain-containing protein n=1 Tax=Eleusine coracana subsp. coracana TaxID=191504 RepID=A0AAV5DZR2_ELECO|nr:hypothetical protein PR202_gb03560 [Eleusine coracana subsp. coracana]GJN16573.1 hypothetical protein PR202_gb03576 [Eleusine coracana subsp. coracana]
MRQVGSAGARAHNAGQVVLASGQATVQPGAGRRACLSESTKSQFWEDLDSMVASEVFDVSREGKQEAKDTWWWNDEVQRAIKEKKECFKRLHLDKGTKEGEKDIYLMARIHEQKTRNINHIKCIKDGIDRLLVRDEEIKDRWRIQEAEIEEALKRMKSGKAMGPDGIPINVWICLGARAIGASMFHAPSRNWLNPQGHSGFIVKKTMRIDIPVDKYPNFNFVGRLLGPRGNSLKRVEANTDCRVLIRGRGSVKDSGREELMRGKPGYEHLNEPLHLVIEAELPAEVVDIHLMQAREILEDMLKPVVYNSDESMDFFKKQQLRELAMLKGTLKDDSSQKSGSVFPTCLG